MFGKKRKEGFEEISGRYEIKRDRYGLSTEDTTNTPSDHGNNEMDIHSVLTGG